MVDDDLEPLITRCPNCSTQFRVTENQLAAAGGRVRCGACLTVFQGTEHLILDEENSFNDGSEADAALDALLDELGPLDGPVSATAESESDDADNTAFLPGTSVELEPLEEAQLYGGFEEADEASVDEASVDEASVDEASAAEPALSEPEVAEIEVLEAEVSATEVSEIAGEDPEPAPEPESAEESEAPVLRVHTSGEEPAVDTQYPDYEAWIRPGLSNLDQLVDEVVASGATPARAESEPDLASSETEERAAASDRFNLSAVEQALAEEGVGTGPIRFAPEPRRWWIPVATAGLALVLAAQFLYLKLPEWSRDPGTRGFYETVCGLLGCDLPEIRALDDLRTRNLMVRSHPDLQDALIIDAVIVNVADFPQRYPDLELRFTSVGGLLVAGRAFTPEEYLGGEARADRLMPVNTPIQVSLEIADPGEEAVNYTLTFR
jgi:predicted Zn finger-like uncharacterized protein